MRARQATAIAAIAAIATAAGCGGGGGSGQLSKSQYEQKMQAEATALKSSVQGLNLLQTTNLKSLATKVASVEGAFKMAGDDIDALKPPKDAESDNQKIADTLHQFANLLDQMKQAASAGDAKKVQQLGNRIQSVGGSADEASKDLKKKGYDIGAFSG